MPCVECGSPCQGLRCRECEMIAACEARHGDRVDDQEWRVEQEGIDGDAQGQATLDGGVRKEGE